MADEIERLARAEIKVARQKCGYLYSRQRAAENDEKITPEQLKTLGAELNEARAEFERLTSFYRAAKAVDKLLDETIEVRRQLASQAEENDDTVAAISTPPPPPSPNGSDGAKETSDENLGSAGVGRRSPTGDDLRSGLQDADRPGSPTGCDAYVRNADGSLSLSGIKCCHSVSVQLSTQLWRPDVVLNDYDEYSGTYAPEQRYCSASKVQCAATGRVGTYNGGRRLFTNGCLSHMLQELADRLWKPCPHCIQAMNTAKAGGKPYDRDTGYPGPYV